MTKFLIRLIFLFLLTNVLSVKAETISFNDVMDQSLSNSYDLKLSAIDINISKSGVKEARADYFPSIKAGLYSEYYRDLTEGTASLTSVGSTIFTPNTKYQDMISLGATYNLFDFGQRKRKLIIAKKDVISKQFTFNMTERELKLKLIDAYTNVLTAYKEYKAKEKLLPIYQELLSIKERLYEAGSVSKVDVSDSIIKVAKTNNEFSLSKAKFEVALKDLSLYTFANYDPENTEILDFSENQFKMVNQVTPTDGHSYKLEVKKEDLASITATSIKYENTPEYKGYQAEIEKKKAELEILNRQRLPQFGLYTNYGFYGKDTNNISQSWGDLNNTNFSVGISTSLVAFDGFKNLAQREKTKLEIEKLKLQRDQKIAGLKNQYEKLNMIASYYQENQRNEENILSLVDNKLSMLQKLLQQQIVDKDKYLNEETELINQKLELEKSIANRISNVKKLYVLCEGTN